MVFISGMMKGNAQSEDVDTGSKQDEEMENSSSEMEPSEMEPDIVVIEDEEEDKTSVDCEDRALVKETTFEEQNNPPRCSTESCYLILDIVSTIILYIMSFLFLYGGVFIHPRAYDTEMKEPLVFYFLGAMCYLTTSILDLIKRKSLGAREISMTSVAIAGGTMWVIGSIFLFMNILKLRVWASLWIVGCICNLVSITHDLIIECLKKEKPLFRTISLGLSWLANILFFGGSVQVLKEFTTLTTCEMGAAATSLASGGAIYIFHSIFHTLSISLKGITFSVKNSP
jgi:hypothetical protein